MAYWDIHTLLTDFWAFDFQTIVENRVRVNLGQLFVSEVGQPLDEKGHFTRVVPVRFPLDRTFTKVCTLVWDCA